MSTWEKNSHRQISDSYLESRNGKSQTLFLEKLQTFSQDQFNAETMLRQSRLVPAELQQEAINRIEAFAPHRV